MKISKLLSILFLSFVLFNSCKPDELEETSSLGLVKTAIFNDENNDQHAQIGETITYTYTVTNTGTTSISNLKINEETIGVSNLEINPSTLAAGEVGTKSISYTITFTDVEIGEISSQATVTGLNPKGETVEDLSDNDSNGEDEATLIVFDLVDTGAYTNGYFVVNEGNFGAGNASLTFVDDNGNIVQEVYNAVNNEAIGDVVQSIFFYGQQVYIVVNNSHKIIVANRYTMEKITIIDGAGINNPRFFVAKGSTGYISNWGDTADTSDDFIAVVDLNTNLVTSTISVGEGPEDMLVVDDKVYINLQGGWGENNKISILDTNTNTISNNLTVAYVPNALVRDSNGDVWVLCAGKPSWSGDETLGQLVRIKNESVFVTFDFNATEHPTHLAINNDILYFTLNGKIYSKGIITAEPIEEATGMDGFYYGLNAKDGKLYTLDAVDYSSEGILKIFDLSSNTDLQSITTGIIPNGVVFND